MTNEKRKELNSRVLVLKLFAASRQIIGKDKITLNLTDEMITVRDLRTMIMELFPSISNKIQFVIAVNHKIADDATTINLLDEVAILPPVSGG